MSDKKKKGGKKSGSAGADKAGDETFKSGEKHMLDEVTLEIYEAKVRDLSEKMER
ncbi:hypothetical protein HK097_010819 [Rhizophlyctis rosea]|uniref:Uncharacterized protein n=1 Tax=Rhizophlyctis rosea TaxID=64517 RepID=A0AAD5S747_9FUNG|nr:hypothetical protein HK097_010819 [Rhizophlyctis rosea]